MKQKLNEANFGGDLLSMVRRDKIKQNLKDLDDSISNSKIWSKLRKQIKEQKDEVQRAKDVLNPPDYKSKVGDLNAKYFASQEYKTRSEMNLEVWRKGVECGEVGVRAFNQVSNWVRHLTFFYDRNRQGEVKKLF